MGLVGRPTILNEEIIKQLYNCILIGMSILRACNYVGISKDTFYEWKKKGMANPDSIYGLLLENIAKAEAGGELKLISDIQKDQSWQSKAWILERRYPEEWSKKETRKNVNVTFGYVQIDSDKSEQIEFRDVEVIEEKKEDV